MGVDHTASWSWWQVSVSRVSMRRWSRSFAGQGDLPRVSRCIPAYTPISVHTPFRSRGWNGGPSAEGLFSRCEVEKGHQRPASLSYDQE